MDREEFLKHIFVEYIKSTIIRFHNIQLRTHFVDICYAMCLLAVREVRCAQGVLVALRSE